MCAQFYEDALDDDLSYERLEKFVGMDNYTRSTLLPDGIFQYGGNTIVVDNLEVGTRPGADTLGEFPATPTAGKSQGLIYFDTPTYEQLITARGEKLYAWNGSAWTEMTGFQLNDADVSFSAAQGVDTALFTDGVSLQIWTGAAWTSGFNTLTSPVGATIVIWHAGRMWAMGFSGATTGKENDAIWASALLDFSTTGWDALNRNFRIGGGEGDPIIAAASMQDFTMAVLKQNSIHLIRTDPTDIPGSYSQSIPPEAVSFGTGCVGKRALAVVGNDLYFVSPDKSIRSLQRMQAAAGQYQLSAPLSIPIQPYVDRINWDVANLIAVKKYKEFVMFSVPLDSAQTPDTTFVYNTRLGQWVGIWTGWTPQAWEVTRFAGVLGLTFGDVTGDVKRWKDVEDQTDDETYFDDAANITTTLWPRALLFNEPLNDKDLFYCELRFSQSNALVLVEVINDNNTVLLYNADVRASPPTLPLTLPFSLTSATNTPIRRGLRGLAPFNEMYLKLTSTSGWFRLRNASFGAFLNTLVNQ